LFGDQILGDEEAGRDTTEYPAAGTEGVAMVYGAATDELNTVGDDGDVDDFELPSTGRGAT
jgi:hypothetical protein